MAEKQSALTPQEIAFLRELRRNRVEFLIVGLGAAMLQGAPAVTQDVDLWFRDLGDPGIRRALACVGGAFVPSVGLSPPMFAGQAVELFDVVVRMDGLRSFAAEASNALPVTIERGLVVLVLPLARIIASKRAAGREKDRLVLPILEDALAALERRGRGAAAKGKRGAAAEGRRGATTGSRTATKSAHPGPAAARRASKKPAPPKSPKNPAGR